MLGGVDLSPYPLDGPLPELPPSPSGSRGHYDVLVAKARKENLTIRQLGAWSAGARGKNAIHGSPARVAVGVPRCSAIAPRRNDPTGAVPTNMSV